MNRRGFLKGMLGLAAAPAIVRAESLMKIAAPKIIVPKEKKILTLSALAADFDGDVVMDPALARKMFYWEEVNRIVKEIADKRMLSPTLFDHSNDQKLIIPDLKPMFELKYGELSTYDLAKRSAAKRQPLKFAYRF